MNTLRHKIIFLLILFVLFLVYIVFIFLSIVKPKSYFKPVVFQKEIALRGSIFTSDYTLAKSKKIYGVYIYPKYLDKNKLSVFFNLFSIYTGIPISKLENLLQKNKNKNRILIAKVDLKTKQNLIYLNKVLDKKRVFINNSLGFRRGLEIVNLEFTRVYPYEDIFEPFLGRYRKDLKKGDNGIEEYYNFWLKAKKDGIKKGYKDVFGNIIYDKNAIIKQPLNGKNLYLNINLALQRKIELLLDKQKNIFNADEVIAAVMDSKTGKILAIATSNRYNPSHILKQDIPNMKIGAIRNLFEPGSVMKPITLAILLEKNRVNPYEMINTENGRWYPKWRGKFGPIIDDERFQSLSVENIIVHSSNIGISKLVMRLNGKEFFEGLKKFGLNSKSGIDLPYEVKGQIRPIKLLNYPVFETTTAYGYGIKVNFIELLRAYNVFNNEGFMINPKIAFIKTSSKKIISAKNAQIILHILRKVVLKGTGKAAFIKGLFTAGKTGTAHVSRNNVYNQNMYNSSFFGFVNDGNKKYTIGVTFYNIKAKWPNYFASNSAVPTFKKIVDIMMEENLLKVNNAK